MQHIREKENDANGLVTDESGLVTVTGWRILEREHPNPHVVMFPPTGSGYKIAAEEALRLGNDLIRATTEALGQ